MLADAPALERLSLSEFGEITGTECAEICFEALFEALPRNRHLRSLDLSECCHEDEFVRDRLLPAVRANTSLRELIGVSYGPAAKEAEDLVSARPPRS